MKPILAALAFVALLLPGPAHAEYSGFGTRKFYDATGSTTIELGTLTEKEFSDSKKKKSTKGKKPALPAETETPPQDNTTLANDYLPPVSIH